MKVVLLLGQAQLWWARSSLILWDFLFVAGTVRFDSETEPTDVRA